GVPRARFPDRSGLRSGQWLVRSSWLPRTESHAGAEHGPGPGQAGVDGRHRNAQQVSDLAVGGVLVVEEDERLPVIRRQSLDLGQQPLTILLAFQDREGGFVGTGEEVVGLMVLVEDAEGNLFVLGALAVVQAD